MNVAAIVGSQKSALVERPEPHAKNDVVVVKIHVAPMCTEYHGFRAGQASDCLGHEAAGEVVEIAQPGMVKVGDRVVVMPHYPCGRCYLCLAGDYIHCRNGIDILRATGNTAGTATYAQYLIKQDWLLLPIPPSMSYEHASMACCGMGPTFGAMQLMHVDACDTILITGMGPVGLGGVINAVSRGARVIAVESHPYRVGLAKQLGAATVIDPTAPDAVQQVMDLIGGSGADKAVETSGAPEAKPLLLNGVRRKGHVAFVGWNGQLDVSTIIAKGLTIHGTWHWNRADTPRILQTIGKAGPKIDKLVTHTFPMSRVQEAWELQLTGKVLLNPWG